MPKSKSKRKAVIQRERGETSALARQKNERRAADAAYERLRVEYSLPFYQEHPDDEEAAYVVDLLFDHSFRWTPADGGSLVPMSEAELVELFCEPVEDMPEYTQATAEVTFERLVRLGKIERADGMVRAVLPSVG